MEVITPAVGDGAPVRRRNTTGFGVLKFIAVENVEELAAELQVEPLREHEFLGQRKVQRRQARGLAARCGPRCRRCRGRLDETQSD